MKSIIRTKNGLPKHCSPVIDRHGKRRVRFRKKEFSTYLTGIPWSDDFMRQYGAALEGVASRVTNIGAARTVAGTMDWLIAAYLDCSEKSSSPFKTLAAETQRTRRNILENFRRENVRHALYCVKPTGEREMLLKRHHVQTIINQKAATPFAQRNLLNTLRAAFEWAVGEGRVPDNPTLGVKRRKVKTAGYKTWSEVHIERLENKWPIGTKERLAIALVLYTGQRRSDVVKLGPRHAEPSRDWQYGVLTIDQGKTDGGEEAHLEIPVHPKLREVLEATTVIGHQTFLVTSFGKSYTANGFGNWFREICDEAGCPTSPPTAAAKRQPAGLPRSELAPTHIAAITGHASLAEVERYTKAANRKRMAREATTKLIEGGW